MDTDSESSWQGRESDKLFLCQNFLGQPGGLQDTGFCGRLIQLGCSKYFIDLLCWILLYPEAGIDCRIQWKFPENGIFNGFIGSCWILLDPAIRSRDRGRL